MSNDYKLLVDFNAPSEEIVINGHIKASGRLSLTIKRETIQNDFAAPYQTVTISGVLSTPYYEKDLQTVETRRYYLSGIDVNEENYGSLEDNIVYKFECAYIRTKYQTEAYEELDG